MIDINIEDTLKQLGIDYKTKDNHYLFHCLNPSHEDKNPSMTMMKENGFCRCWSCGKTYTLAELVKLISGKTFYEFFNIKDVNDYKFKSGLRKKVVILKPKREMIIEQGTFHNVHDNMEVMEYLNSIHVNERVIEYFNISYIKQLKVKFLNSITKPTFLCDRITIPVIQNKEIVNLEARDFTSRQKPKVLYPKGALSDMLFNLENIDTSKPVIVVEGMKSLFRVWRHISKNVVSTFGSLLGAEQKKLLSKLDNVVLFPDNDEAGYEMIETFEKFYDKEYRIALMPKKDYDPSDGTLTELKFAVTSATRSSTYLLNKYDLFPKPTVSWY